MTPARSSKTTRTPQLLARKTVGVVGLGQIGGSIVKRLSHFTPRITVLGTDIDSNLRRRATRYCQWCPSLDEIVRRSDLVILAVHVPRILKLLPDVAASTAHRTQRSRLLVADTGTIKDPVAKLARRYRAAFDFVALHPLAGSERPGWNGSSAVLFDGSTTVFWPEGSTRDTRLIRELIHLLGSQPLRIEPSDHDRLISLTIGLPHMLAFAAQGLSDSLSVPPEVKGRSWSSLTRVAASDPAMVAGFLCTNANATAAAARQFSRRLDRLIAALKDPTGKKVEALLRSWKRDPG